MIFSDRAIQERLNNTVLIGRNKIDDEILALGKKLKVQDSDFYKYEQLINENISILLRDAYRQGFVDGIDTHKDYLSISQRKP